MAWEGHWGRGQGVFYPDGSIIIDAIVIAVV